MGNDDSHLPPSSVRSTGRAGVGDDGDDAEGRHDMSETSYSKTGHSRPPSFLAGSAQSPYSDDAQHFQNYANSMEGYCASCL
jgi:hypothetical protein